MNIHKKREYQVQQQRGACKQMVRTPQEISR